MTHGLSPQHQTTGAAWWFALVLGLVVAAVVGALLTCGVAAAVVAVVAQWHIVCCAKLIRQTPRIQLR
jgi:hypothetical protein